MTETGKRNALWCAGDFLASLVIPEFARRFPDLVPCGVAGPKMREAGLTAWEDASTLSVRGYVEVIKRIPAILGLRHRLLARATREKPALFVGVDAPDFNLGI